MNFSLLLPSALAALAALALPLLIHLSRRAEHKPTDFAALRWLSAHRRPQRKWLLQERTLLAIRLLLLMALALFLAQPVMLSQTKPEPEHWIVVVPGAKVSDIKQLPSGNKVKWHWLAPGFPDFDQALPTTNIALSSLLRQLDAQLPANTELSVVVPEKLAGLDGQRIQLSRKVNWLLSSGEMVNTSPVKTVQPIKLSIRYDQAHLNSVAYFKAAQLSWHTDKNKPADVDSSLLSDVAPNKNRALVWLATGELPKTIMQWTLQGGILITSNDVLLPENHESFPMWRDAQGNVLLREWQAGSGRILQWQIPLVPSSMPELLEANFPDRLFNVLSTSHNPITIGMALQQSPQKGKLIWPAIPQPMGSWLLWLIMLLFVVERWLSGRNKTWTST